MSFINPFQYAQKHDLKSANVYRWIREGKFKDSDIKIATRTVSRITIEENAIPSIEIKKRNKKPII